MKSGNLLLLKACKGKTTKKTRFRKPVKKTRN